MGGCRCSYKNCTNTTQTADNIHFFHYPVKYRERCVKWIENAGKQNFYNLEEEQLRNKVVCEMHFEDSCFLNDQKKRLIQTAVPTLDGDSTSSPSQYNKPYQQSNQYNDVKVVPANDDGTVFVLDTENMFTISPKIESYIIKNGVLVPTNSNISPRAPQGRLIKQATSNRFTKPSTSNNGYVMGAETEIANINTPPGPSNPLIKDNAFDHNVLKTEAIEPVDANTENDEFGLVDDKKSENEPTKQNEEKKSKLISKVGVSRNYLRQIKKHSRDIASIKRMLMQKQHAKQPKIDLKTILKELQPQIPASLFTVITLILGEKNELNDEDIEFFTTLHRGSTEVYQLLSEKYKWNLPSVDVLDVPPE